MLDTGRNGGMLKKKLPWKSLTCENIDGRTEKSVDHYICSFSRQGLSMNMYRKQKIQQAEKWKRKMICSYTLEERYEN